jgi:hypothetical protein
VVDAYAFKELLYKFKKKIPKQHEIHISDTDILRKLSPPLPAG